MPAMHGFRTHNYATMGLAAVLLLIGPTVGRAAVAWITSPSGNLACEMADRYAGSTSVPCQSFNKPHTVTMGLSGRLKICRGELCLSNAPANTVTLAYNTSRTVGRFRSTSLRASIRCIVTATRPAFLINRDGITRVRP